MMDDLVARIRDRINDAPLETERMLDEAADEIVRLRALLDDNGIDSEPYVQPPPFIGPPTLLEHITRVVVNQYAAKFIRDLAEPSPLLRYLSGCSVRIRLPKDYAITRNTP